MIVLFPLWRRRWWVKSVLDSDDRLDAARSHAVMNPPNKLVILCKRARVLAGSDQKQCRSKLSQVFRPRSPPLPAALDRRRPDQPPFTVAERTARDCADRSAAECVSQAEIGHAARRRPARARKRPPDG